MSTRQDTAASAIDVGRRSLRALARVLLERREVGGQGHIVERPVGEPGVEPPERAGVREQRAGRTG